MDPAPTADIIELEQVLARYAVGMTRDDVEAVMEVFTPDGTYSAFGTTYALKDFPALVAAAPKGLFLTGTPVLDLDPHKGSGTGYQTLCFVEQTTHDMRIGWYTDTYRKTDHGWRLQTALDDLLAAQRRARLRQGARPGPSGAVILERLGGEGSAVELAEFKVSVDRWLDEHAEEIEPEFEGIGTLDEQMAQLRKIMRLGYDAGFTRWGWPERVGGLGGSNLLRARISAKPSPHATSSNRATTPCPRCLPRQ